MAIKSEHISYRDVNKLLGHDKDKPRLYPVGSKLSYLIPDPNNSTAVSPFCADLETVGIDYESIAYESAGSIELHIAGSLDFDTDDEEGAWTRLLEGAEVLGNINEIVREYFNFEEEWNTPSSETRFLNESVEKYLKELALDDESWSEDVDAIIKFVQWYAQYCQDFADKKGWPRLVSAWQDEVISFLKSDDSSHIMSAESAQRSAESLSVCPIRITDPLSSQIDYSLGRYDGIDLYGAFFADKRLVETNPFKIATAKDEGRDPDVEFIHTLTHEFIHATTAAMYRSSPPGSGVEGEKFYSCRLWPEFFDEGMTEKLATYILNQITQKDAGLPADPELSRYTNPYAYIINPPKEVWPTGDISEHEHTPKAYLEYRVVIDAVINKLDWAAADLTKEQAMQLACYAFYEVPEDGVKYRSGFIEAINKAAHPGFFMKLANIVDLHGASMASRILLDPKFDPHDPMLVTYVASTQELNYIADALRSLPRIQGFVDHLRDRGVSIESILLEEARLRRAEKTAAKLGPVQDAKEAQKSLLKSSHPPMTLEERLIRAIFGNPDNSAAAQSSLAELALRRKEWHQDKRD